MDISTCPFPFSISMTTCSTLLALGMMPLCLLIYTKMWVDSGMIIIPYDNIGKSFLYKISECHLPTPCLCQLRLRPGSDPDSFASCTSGKLWAIRFCAKSHLYLNNGWQNLNSKSDPMGEPLFSSTEITWEGGRLQKSFSTAVWTQGGQSSWCLGGGPALSLSHNTAGPREQQLAPQQSN